ncbi:MAG TPA: BMP family ABC transporter substrate-binding protein [Thermomicrobiales bacterium]
MTIVPAGQLRLSRRRFSALAALAPLAAAMPVGGRIAMAQDSLVCTMVTDTVGLGDQNFNDLANNGGTDAARDFGITWRVVESQDASAYVPNLVAGAEQGDLTVAVGALLTDALAEVAPQFPDDWFLLIDSVVDQPNVQSVTFREQESAFLVGVAAGMFTKTGTIGIVGGMRIPPVIRYEVGFKAGVLAVRPDANFSIAYADSFTDPAKGKELAVAQFNQGADIVLPIAGLTGVGCYEAVKERNRLGEEWVIGADVTQDHLAPGFELCVARKGVDVAVYEGCRQLAEGTFEGGIHDLGLKESGVDFQDPNDRVPEEIKGYVRAYKQMILDGALVVPTTDEEFETFSQNLPPLATPIAAEATPAATPGA